MEKRTEREIRAMVARVGLQVVSLRDTGRVHILAEVKAPDGRLGQFVFGGTPSDCRAGKAIKALLKRFVNNVVADETARRRLPR